MLSQKNKGILICLLLLSLSAAGFFGWWGAALPLEQVTATLPAGESVYGIDQGKHTFRFFHADTTGRLLAEIRQETQADGCYFSYGPLVEDGDAVYVLERQADIQSDLIRAERVLLCNFDRGRLEPAWELPVRDPAQDSNFAIQVRGGVLSCFQQDYTGKQATGRLLRAVQGGTLTEVAAFSYDIGIGFTDFYAAASGAMAFTTPAGEIYTLRPGEPPQKRFPIGTESKPLYLFANDGADGVYAAGADQKIYRLDLSGDGRPALLLDGAQRGLPLSTLSALRFAPDGSFTAAQDEGQTLGIYRDAGDLTIHRLAAQPGHIALRALLGFAGVWMAAALLALLLRFFFFLTRGKVPVVTKLLAAFLPILILSMALMNTLVTGIFARDLIDGQYERLYLLTRQQTATLNDSYITGIDPKTAFDSVYFYEIRAALNVLPGQGTIYEPAAEEPQAVYNSNYFWLYRMVDDKLVSLICEQDYVGVPVEERYSPAVSAQFYEAAETGRTIRTGFRDELGDWTILLTPVTDNSGQVVAVIETGDTRQSLDYAVAWGARQLTLLNLAVLLGLALLLSAVIVLSLYPLKTLKARVQEISDGKLGVQAPAHGNDEIADVTRVFNTMSRNVEFRDQEIRLTSEGYARFVPARVFGLLEKSSVIDVRLEDQTSVEATVLNCALGGFDEIARSLRSKEMFRLINEVLARLVPVVDSSGGLVDRFDRAGLLAIYTERPDRALDAAVTLCQTIRSAEFEGLSAQALQFHVTLSAGPAMIGIVGAEKRLEAMTISEHTSFTGFLRPLALRYGASVLITGSAAGLIPDFDSRYHARTIGFVRMRTLDTLERLYDVYDGDGETVRRLKDETREIFEKGVALFCSHQYYDARLLFIEVLKKHREDRAAKNYLYLCDTYYREENSEKQDVWIESY